jgi:hypothetical protein
VTMPAESANLPLLYSACHLTTEFVHKSSGLSASGTATGFFIRRSSGSVTLVSNRHALEREYFDSKYVGYELTSVKVKLFLRSEGRPVSEAPRAVEVSVDSPMVTAHSDGTVDVACMSLHGSGLIDDRGGSSFLYSIGESSLAVKEDFDSRIDVGEIVFFPGYPEWHDKSEYRPILRYGRIVSDPRRDYRQSEGEARRSDGRQQLAIEAFSFSGNSGSPVFLEKHGNISLQGGLSRNSNLFYRPQLVIGINAGHLTATEEQRHGGHHSGLSFIYRSTAIRELLARVR